MSDHNLLELLLFYSIPRVDTNETAHRLLETFGSLEGVFRADLLKLTSVIGVGENNNFGHPNSDVLNRLEELRYKSL